MLSNAKQRKTIECSDFKIHTLTFGFVDAESSNPTQTNFTYVTYILVERQSKQARKSHA